MATVIDTNLSVSGSVSTGAWGFASLGVTGNVSLTGTLTGGALHFLGNLTTTGSATVGVFDANTLQAFGELDINSATTVGTLHLGYAGVAGGATVASLTVTGSSTSILSGDVDFKSTANFGTLNCSSFGSSGINSPSITASGSANFEGTGSLSTVEVTEEVRVQGSVPEIIFEYLARTSGGLWKLKINGAGELYAAP